MLLVFGSIFVIVVICLTISALVGPGISRDILKVVLGFGLLCALPFYAVWFFIDTQGAIHSPWFWGATICLLGVLEWLKRNQ